MIKNLIFSTKKLTIRKKIITLIFQKVINQILLRRKKLLKYLKIKKLGYQFLKLKNPRALLKVNND